MKKYLFVIICLLGALCSYGQEKSEHFTFKGVPIDGHKNEFLSKLKQKGFKPHPEDPSILTGRFAGYSDSKIYCLYDEEKKLTYGAGVAFPYSDNWATLSSTYYSLKNMLIEKYGEPSDETEEFQRPLYADDDSMKIHELKMGRATFKTSFRNDKGTIVLSIGQLQLSCFVSLLYMDLTNADVVFGNAQDDL